MISVKVLLNNLPDILTNLQKRRYSEVFLQKVEGVFQEAQLLQNYEKQQQKLQQERNILIKQGINTKEEVIILNEKISLLEKVLQNSQNLLKEVLPLIPNFLDTSVPDGDNDQHNLELYRWGETSHHRKNHYDMGLVGNGSTMTCSRFIFLEGQKYSLPVN